MTANDPLIEIELRDALPRRVRYTRSLVRLRRIAWNAALAAFCLASYLASRDIDQLADLMHNSIITRSPVTSAYVRQGSNRTCIAESDYSVDVDAPCDNVLARVSANCIHEECMKWYRAIGFVSLVLLAGLFGLEWFWNRRRVLLRDGVAVVGTIEDCRKVFRNARRDDVLCYKLTYCFPLANGMPWRHEVRISEDQYRIFRRKIYLTILRDPIDPLYKSLPFLLIAGAEIEGAPRRNADGTVARGL